MRRYKNGDRCPCCGQEIRGKSETWLEAFSNACDVLGFTYHAPEGPLVVEELEQEREAAHGA